LCSDVDLIQLATNINLSSRLDNEWALYPDHIVFLGEEAVILDGAMDSVDIGNSNPPFIFEIGVGVYESKLVTIAQKLQLRCYYDVLIRQPAKAKLVTLSSDAIAELLNWDAEKYRRLQF
jgi:rhamnose utilization protein RhaD (predicted bifunctional aldolase and dehydrogenase)